MGESSQTFAGFAGARGPGGRLLSPPQRLLLERAIALIICASICVMALGLVPHHRPAAPGRAIAISAAIA